MAAKLLAERELADLAGGGVRDLCRLAGSSRQVQSWVTAACKMGECCTARPR